MKTKYRNLDIIIGENIKRARAMAGMSQTTLGKTFNVSFQQIQKYENGTNRISASVLYLVACVLGRDMNWFMVRHVFSKQMTMRASDRQAKLLRDGIKAKQTSLRLAGVRGR